MTRMLDFPNAQRRYIHEHQHWSDEEKENLDFVLLYMSAYVAATLAKDPGFDGMAVVIPVQQIDIAGFAHVSKKHRSVPPPQDAKN